MRLQNKILLHLGILAGIMATFHVFEIDLWIQDRFHDFHTHTWLVNRKAFVPRLMFYLLPKYCLVTLGVSCVVVVLLSFRNDRLAPLRRRALFLFLSLALIPMAVAALKNTTNVYTPSQVTRYGGKAPYAKTLSRYPDTFHSNRKGKGFPAGHASGGFALMAGYFLFAERRRKLTALIAALVVGWVMGLYQTLNGQHYLSHTFVTMSLAWLILLVLDSFVRPELELQFSTQFQTHES